MVLNEDFTVDDLPNDLLRAIYQYWLDVKGARQMPSYADINPDDIVELWPHINLIEVDTEKNRYRCKRVGSETVKSMNIDFTGKYLDEFPFIETLLKKKYDGLVEKKRPYFNFDKLKWSSSSLMDYYALGLPLSSNGKDVDMILLGLFYQFPKETRTKFYQLGG